MEKKQPVNLVLLRTAVLSNGRFVWYETMSYFHDNSSSVEHSGAKTCPCSILRLPFNELYIFYLPVLVKIAFTKLTLSGILKLLRHCRYVTRAGERSFVIL